MADQDLIDYIKRYKNEFGLEKLRKGLLQQGVSYVDIKKALEEIEGQEEEKIAGFLRDNPDIPEEEIIDDAGGNDSNGYKKKANEVINVVSGTLGVSRRDKKIYVDIVKYGAISFVFISIISTLFEYLAGIFVYPKLSSTLGVFGHLALPDAFLVQINLWSLLLSILWAAVVGGIITFIFIRYLIRFWPFSLWSRLFKKVFAFYLIFELFFGIIVNILTSGFSSFYIVLGYLIIIIGMVLGSYAAATYFSNNMISKHEDKLKEIIH